MLASVFIMSCSNEIKVGTIECGNIQIPNYSYSFKDGKCYQDGQLIGNVVFSDEKIIQVELSNETIRTLVRLH